MTKRIFRSIFFAAFCVLLASLAIITGCLYEYYSNAFENQMRDELNLAAAAQVFAYEIRRVWREAQPEAPADPPPDLATAEELDGFNRHLRETLLEIGFGDPEHSKKLLLRLRQLFNRARPDRVEINILRGILSAAQGRKSHKRRDPGTDA